MIDFDKNNVIRNPFNEDQLDLIQDQPPKDPNEYVRKIRKVARQHRVTLGDWLTPENAEYCEWYWYWEPIPITPDQYRRVFMFCHKTTVTPHKKRKLHHQGGDSWHVQLPKIEMCIPNEATHVLFKKLQTNKFVIIFAKYNKRGERLA